MFAIEIQSHLKQLHAERALAVIEGMAADGAYLADLDDEIAATASAYVCAAVTEIAMFRGELYGRKQG
jgi:hypothetical protein